MLLGSYETVLHYDRTQLSRDDALSVPRQYLDPRDSDIMPRLCMCSVRFQFNGFNQYLRCSTVEATPSKVHDKRMPKCMPT